MEFNKQDIIEVTRECDIEYKQRKVCVVYKNFKEVAAFPTFEEAMKFVYSNWKPVRN